MLRTMLLTGLLVLAGVVSGDAAANGSIESGTAAPPCHPDYPCGGGGIPKDPKDPPPPRPTYYYPAEGWNVITASEANIQRGVQWWAYAWEGSTLRVKAYYPSDFDTGITVGAETAHAFITFEVTSPVEWTAWSHVRLPRWYGVKEQNGYVRSYMDPSGVVTLHAAQGYEDCRGDICETRDYSGIYQDDGTGAVLVQGSDALTSVGSAVVASFLQDLAANGGALAPPGTEGYACGDECLSGMEQYMYRHQNYVQNLLGDPRLTCGAAVVSSAACLAGVGFLIFSGPVGIIGWPLVGGVCSAAFGADVSCAAAIESADPSPQGTCVIVVTPTWVVGPDGRSSQITYQVQESAACKY
jgi:hypothetical protein